MVCAVTVLFLYVFLYFYNRTIILKVPASQASAFSANASPEVGKSKLENLRAALAATINKQVHQVLTPITSTASPQQTVQMAPPGATVQIIKVKFAITR